MSDSKQHKGSMLPTRRPITEFLVEKLADEVLVYDQTHHAAHCLTVAAALVWDLCDGEHSTEDAQKALRAAGSSDAVDAVVTQLVTTGLVCASPPPVDAPVPVARKRGVNRSRRAMLSRGAVAAGVVLASPVIFSIVAPSVAQAASDVGCGKSGQPCCTQGADCNPPNTGLCEGGFCP